jgi:uncharacterized protein YbcI
MDKSNSTKARQIAQAAMPLEKERTNHSTSTIARQIAKAACAFEKQRTGHLPKSMTVVLSGDTLVITLRGALSPAETALAKSPAGAAELQELHRRLFATSAASLHDEIKRITGVEVRETRVDMETVTGAVMQMFATGTVVQVFLLADKVPENSWSGSEFSDLS